MKQKNLILMVVAVGCGLAAAFLTSRMSAGPKTEAIPQREVWVAVKDLNPPTKFTKESIKDLVKKKVMNASDVAEDAIETEEELLEQSLVQAVTSNVPLQKSHVNKNGEVPIPTGKAGLMSLKLPLEQVTPFIKPTSRVNLLGTVTNRTTNKVSGTVLIPNMHVTAVDSDYIPAPGAPQGKMQVQVITLAVSIDETRLIRMAQTAGVTMSLMLIGKPEEQANVANSEWDVDRVIGWINDAASGSGGQPQGTTPPTTPTPVVPQYVKVPVAIEDLAEGLELTSDVIATKFKMIDFVEAPGNAVVDLKGHIGHFLKKEVGANQFLTEAIVSNKPPVKPTKAAPDDAPSTKEGTELPPKVAAKKKPFVDKSITTPSGTKTFRYEQQEDMSWKLIGEIQPDGTIAPTNGGIAPTPADEKKAEPQGEPRRIS
ncbi:Flp pilus assembly protein CpaB [Limnoglobus roseus]|uniref:Flp pilus assembly protein CpaB n=1 Tax=Limnoglobus roseus TaxID=2598579 RepID=A0A5C1A4D6_9BACT|nr:hypothetical protein [Limnoglobus roseus]QEL13225.1 Flp pilus assembly protein CpaB [Limnoglobus roseus]